MAAPVIKQLMDATSISRSVTRITHEILERNDGPQDIALIEPNPYDWTGWAAYLL